VVHEHAPAHLLSPSAEIGAGEEYSVLPKPPRGADHELKSREDDDEEERKRMREEVLRGSKTTVKRPVRLAKLQQKTRYIRNQFGQCAESFFAAVMRTLLHALDRLHEELLRGGIPQGLLASDAEAGAMDPGLSVLLPAQALLSLGAFVKSAMNTLCQRWVAALHLLYYCYCNDDCIRKLIDSLLPVATRLRAVPYLHLRRAATVASSDCVEALLYLHEQQRLRSTTGLLGGPEFGTLDYAMNLGGGLVEAGAAEVGGDGAVCSSQVAETVNWAMTAIREEPDIQCRVFQYEIVKNAVRHFESTWYKCSVSEFVHIIIIIIIILIIFIIIYFQ
jgi:hypothetical protein